MALGDVIARLSVVLGMDTAAFEAGATISERRLNQMAGRLQAVGGRMSSLGQSLSIGLTAPLAAFGVTAVSAANESAAALGQVEAALASMGNASGRSLAQLEELATNQMGASLYDDDEILRKVTANLLTFGNVAGESFDRGQQAALDLAARLGTDLQGAALQVGKALNDPIRGITGLTRAGVSFTEQQKAQIRAMTQTGDLAGAQGIILGELERQFGGAAAAMRDADPMAAMRQSFAEFQETVGQKILPLLPAITGAITSVLDAFGRLSPGMQQAVVVGGLLAAALGPVLLVAGGLTSGIGSLVSAFAPFISVVGMIGANGGVLLAAKAALAGIGAVIGPVLGPIAAVAAVGALIYANWDKIGPVLGRIGERFNEVLGPKLRELIDTVSTKFTELWEGPLGQGIRAVGAAFLDFQLAYAEVMGDSLVRVLSVAVDLITGTFSIIFDAIDLVVSLLTGDWQGAWDAAGNIVATWRDTVLSILDTIVPGAAAAITRMATTVATKLTEFVATVRTIGRFIVDGIVAGINAAPEAVWNALRAVVLRGVDNVREFLGIRSPSRLFMEIGGFVTEGLAIGIGNGAPAVQQSLTNMLSDISVEMARLEAVLVRPIERATSAAGQAFRQLQQTASSVLDRLFPEDVAERAYRAERAALDAALTGTARDAALRRLADERALELRQARFPAMDFGARSMVPDMARVQDAIKTLTKTAEVNTVRIAKSFGDMAQDAISSLRSLASALKSGDIFGILESVLGIGLQLGNSGIFGSKVSGFLAAVPAFAGGTNFAPGGMALVGERGPELVDLPRGSRVTPNNQLGGLTRVEVIPSPYFDVRVDGRVQAAAPGIANAGAGLAASRGAYRQSRRLA